MTTDYFHGVMKVTDAAVYIENLVNDILLIFISKLKPALLLQIFSFRKLAVLGRKSEMNQNMYDQFSNTVLLLRALYIKSKIFGISFK